MRLIVLFLSLALLLQAPAAGSLPALPVSTVVRSIAARPRADLYRM